MRSTPPLLLASILFACSGQTQDTSPAPAPAPTHAPAPPSRPAPPPAPTSGTGTITLVTSVDVLSASAFFGPDDSTPLTTGCVAASTSNTPAAQPSASAGDITIDVPGQPGAIVLSYDTITRAYASSYTGVAVPAGSTVHVHAAGSEQISAFDADIATTAAPDVTAPADGAALPSGDLPITWTPTTEPSLHVVLEVDTSQIACAFDGASGKGVIPAALLGPAVATSDGSQPAVLSALVRNATQVKAGAFDVDLSHVGVAVRELKVAR